MIIQLFNDPTPVIQIDNFLPAPAAAEVLQECIDLKPVYRPAEVLNAQKGSEVDANIRQNEVVYIDQVFKGNVKKSKILQTLLQQGIWGPDALKLWAAGNTGFEILTRLSKWETVLSRYGNGHFYDFHRDYNFNWPNRLISAIYYANLEPKVFTGGKLAFRGQPENLTIEPVHNRLVVFNSGAYHRVEKTELESTNFADGRFSINMWFGYNT